VKPNGKRPLRRPRRRRKYDIKMFLKKWGRGMGWIDLGQDGDRWRPDVCAGMKFQVY
jgi:hypothetical protein